MTVNPIPNIDYRQWDLDISKLRFFPAYTGNLYNGRKETSFRKYPRRGAGVYCIKEDGVLVYVGMSGYSVLYVLYKHFQVWIDKRRIKGQDGYARITYVQTLKLCNYEVSIITTVDKAEAMELEKRLILKYKPRDNTLKLTSYILTVDNQLSTKTALVEEEDWLEGMTLPVNAGGEEVKFDLF